MNALFRAWDRFWQREAPPDALAIFRIAFGAYLLVEGATYLPFATTMFSNEGLAIAMHTGLSFLAPPSPPVAWAVACAYMAASALLLVGYRTTFALLALVFLYLYYWQLSFYAFPSSYHRLFFTIFLVLLLGGSDNTFSLRMRRERGSWLASEPMCILPQRLISVQITATYAVVGAQKWWLPHWQDGRIMYHSFIGRWGSPLARWFVLLGPPAWVYGALTLFTKVLETFLPFGLWIPRVRWFAFAGGAIFHVAIALLIGIWWFLPLIPAYILFLPPESVAAWVRKRLRR